MRDLILKILSNKSPIKMVDLALAVMNEYGPGKFSTEIFHELTDNLISEGEIICLEYTMPEMPDRVKSILFKRGTELVCITGTKLTVNKEADEWNRKAVMVRKG
jgi:hypothetical protein